MLTITWRDNQLGGQVRASVFHDGGRPWMAEVGAANLVRAVQRGDALELVRVAADSQAELNLFRTNAGRNLAGAITWPAELEYVASGE